MALSSTDFSANIERFSGFADLYDRYRPLPPAILASVLTQLAKSPFPDLVVDLGSGTGLSTRFWADRARTVIGIEPTADMRNQAAAMTSAANVSYREGFSHHTELPDNCAQIVACSQALHWMEPQSTFVEVRRILQPGGVFAAFDYDWPPMTSEWEADAAYSEFMEQMQRLEKQHASHQHIKRWEKHQHLPRLRASGCFRFVQEIVVHHVDQGNAGRLVGLALSQGGAMTLLKDGVSEAELGIENLREVAQRTLGDEPKTWYWSSRVRIGVK